VIDTIGTGNKNNPNEIHIDPAISARAKLPIDRMLDFAAAQKKLEQSKTQADFQPNIGPA